MTTAPVVHGGSLPGRIRAMATGRMADRCNTCRIHSAAQTCRAALRCHLAHVVERSFMLSTYTEPLCCQWRPTALPTSRTGFISSSDGQVTRGQQGCAKDVVKACCTQSWWSLTCIARQCLVRCHVQKAQMKDQGRNSFIPRSEGPGPAAYCQATDPIKQVRAMHSGRCMPPRCSLPPVAAFHP